MKKQNWKNGLLLFTETFHKKIAKVFGHFFLCVCDLKLDLSGFVTEKLLIRIDLTKSRETAVAFRYLTVDNFDEKIFGKVFT